MANCNQCGKPAVFVVGQNPLCVDCNLKVQQAFSLQNARYVQEMNYLTEEMESITGLSGSLPSYRIPQPIIHQGAINYHNIKVNNSVIGAINTGDVQNIDVTMDYIKASGNEELVQELKIFTEAVINEVKINQDSKNHIIEQLSFLMTEYKASKENQRRGIIKSVISGIRDTVSTATGLLTLWDRLLPLLHKVFSN